MRALEASAPGASLFVGAGDLIGASPLISGIFHDEPTIEALDAMGMDYAGVGNQEFDEGAAELIRMQYGGCHPEDGCVFEDAFSGADFRYLAANVRLENRSQTLLPPYMIKHVGGIPVAFIGLTLEDTPSIVTAAGVAGLEFDDEADTVIRFVRELSDERRIETFVILLHEGGQQNPPYAAGFPDPSGCENLSGPITGIVDRLDQKVDVVLTAHTHQPYVCKLGGKVVTSASSFGRLVTRVDMTLSGTSRDVSAISAANELVTRTVTPDPVVASIVDKARTKSAPLANRVVGRIATNINRQASPSGESPLGNLIADAQLEATDDPGTGNAVIAFMNPGGVRADLTYASSSAGEGDGVVTYGELFAVQPFANELVTKTMTGAQIDAVLEQQRGPSSLMLQVSDSLRYTWSASAPAGQRVDPSSILINGTPIDPAASYRVTMNAFLAGGGDGFTVFRDGTNPLVGVIDLDALEAYFASFGTTPVVAPATNRLAIAP